MTETTPHALWKGFCRFMEHKAFARRFGDGYGQRFDSFAIFEISASQHGSMRDSGYAEGDFSPPFPFPKIVLIFPDFLIALEQPEMNLDTGVLQYEATIYLIRESVDVPSGMEQMDDGSRSVVATAVREEFKSVVATAVRGCEELAMATVKIDSERSTQDGTPVAEIVDFRMQIHYADDEIVDYADDMLFSSKINANTQRIRATGNRELIAELDRMLEESQRVEGQLRDTLKEHLRFCFLLGILSIAWINRPKHYIVEQGPEIDRKSGKKDRERVRRLAERSRHIVIDHDEIRQRWTNHHGTHGSPMPHLRRGHYKTLRAERYKNMRGKVIWVAPCHVGGECVEWREGSVSYKVVG